MKSKIHKYQKRDSAMGKTTSLFISAIMLVSSMAFSQHDERHRKHGTKHGSNTANEYMHRSSTEHLIKNFESPARDAYQKPEKVLEYLGELEGKKIMDIGAGSGYFSVKLASKGARVIAADVNDEFQAALQKRIDDNKLENIELRKIPYDSPNLADEEVDMVLIVNTYHHIENRSDYFEKVKQGIKDGGELVVIDYFKKEIPVGPPVNHKVSLETVKRELEQAGYTQLDVNTELLPYQFIVRAK